MENNISKYLQTNRRTMLTVFNPTEVDGLIARINKLTPRSKPLWGRMSVSQMLAHCNVSYELAYENKHPRPGAFGKFLIKLFAKETVVGNKPYKKNQPTGPAFKIAGDRDFMLEKERLIGYLQKTLGLGEAHFDNLESHSFGKLSKEQWNTMFYKHLEHHLTQFGV